MIEQIEKFELFSGKQSWLAQPASWVGSGLGWSNHSGLVLMCWFWVWLRAGLVLAGVVLTCASPGQVVRLVLAEPILGFPHRSRKATQTSAPTRL